MKENRNKKSQRDQQQQAEKQNTGANKRDTSAPERGLQNSPGAVNAPEKKPISHRTGDATNFGDRSYRED